MKEFLLMSSDILPATIMGIFTTFVSVFVVYLNAVVKRKNSEKESQAKKIAAKQDLPVAENMIVNMQYNGNSSELNDLLEAYHQQALQQSQVQFWFSLASSVVGFVFIVVMVAITVAAEKASWYEYLVKTAPGAIMEAVSVLFLAQARETRDRATDFFKELNYERQISKSVEIADSISEPSVQDSIKAKIALHIINLKEPDEKMTT